eukprot:4696686-Pleurochrysis_carterae.AAC.1
MSGTSQSEQPGGWSNSSETQMKERMMIYEGACRYASGEDRGRCAHTAAPRPASSAPASA